MKRTLSDEQIKELRRQRELAIDRYTAHMLAAKESAQRIRAAVGHIKEANYGQAREVLELLLSDLPHDNGGPVTHTLMFDRHFKRQRERRGEES